MRLLSFPLAASLLLALIACGAEPPPALAPGSSGPPSVTPTSPPVDIAKPAETTAPAASAAPAAPEAPASPDEDPKGPFKFTAYSGPKVKKTPGTPKVWAPVPVGLGDEWDILKIVLIEVARTEGDVVVLRDWRKLEMFVPGALVHDAPAQKDLKKGDAILADVAASSAPARVVAITKEDDTTRVKFKYNWVSPSDGELDIDQVRKLTDKLTVGQRVAYKKDDVWETATYVGGDASKSFIIWGSGQAVVDTKALKPMTLTKIFKNGDKVWAGKFDLKPAKVTGALNDATQYKVKFADGKEETIDFDEVTAPLE